MITIDEMKNMYDECRDLKEFMRIRAKARPDVPLFAVYGRKGDEPERVITSADFKREVDALGTWFYCNGYRNRHIAILGENSYEWILTMMAAVTGSNTALFLDTTKSAEELSDIVSFCDAEVIVVSDSYSKTAMDIKKNTGIALIPMESLSEKVEEGRKRLDEGCTDFIDHVIDPDGMSVICCTSGTTGRSKGVMISQSAIVKVAVSSSKVVGYYDFGRTFVLLPLYHIYPLVHNIFMNIALGGTLCFTPGIRTFAADYMKIRPEMLPMVPRLVEVLAQFLEKMPEAPAPKFILCGGSAPSLELMEELAKKGVRVATGYGLTETAASAAINMDSMKYRDGSMAVLPDVDFKVIDCDQQGIGELLLSGPGIMIGYYKLPEETEKVLDKDGFLHTGDLVSLTEENRIIIKGRKDRMMVLPNGLNVHPQEIEEDIMKVDGVTELIVRLEDGVITARIYAEDFSKRDQIREAVNEINKKCPAYRQTERIVFTDEPLPRTAAGKIKLD